MSSHYGVSLGNGKVKRSTDKAILVYLDTERRTLWIPKSVIHDDSMLWKGERDEEGDVVVHEWWAEERNLI